MKYKIDLCVVGIDLSDERTLDRIVGKLTELSWAATDGTVTASLYTDDDDPVRAALDHAQLIRDTFPDARVTRVDEDLVAISDIALRLTMSRETIRKYVSGERGPGGFPEPRGSVSAGGAVGSTRVWAWADVSGWLEHHYSLEPEDRYLDPVQVALLNARLAQAAGRPARPEAGAWREADTAIADVFGQTSALRRTTTSRTAEHVETSPAQVQLEDNGEVLLTKSRRVLVVRY